MQLSTTRITCHSSESGKMRLTGTELGIGRAIVLGNAREDA
jgi:hypothetical protein